AGGAMTISVPYGTANVFGGAGAGAGATGTGTGTTTGTGTGTGTTAGGGGTATGTGTAPRSVEELGALGTSGPAAPKAFDPASVIGRSFSINASSTAEGDLARGGVLQVQKFVDTSAGGFGTAEEAASAARAARASSGGGDQWSRVITLQGADNRFYVYQGSLVARATAELQDGSPMHVFGPNFAEFYDGTTSSWKAVRDAA
ncbi:MAG: hypothetical protein JWM98_408, partial [Thermoleophilia bacterium]|nr:hypothetical protein [Thermoleophilia bacterium]